MNRVGIDVRIATEYSDFVIDGDVDPPSERESYTSGGVLDLEYCRQSP